MTNKQKQNLLQYLGYYDGAIDGLWGQKSSDATGDFQSAEGLDADKVFGKATESKILDAVYSGRFKKDSGADEIPSEGDDIDWDSVPYFTKAEFSCQCGGKYCDGFPAKPDKQLVQICVVVREHFGVPFIISSGVRCTKHNAAVGGVYNSCHLSGKAVDFCIKGKTSGEVLAYVKTLPGIKYAYAIDSDYVHINT